MATHFFIHALFQCASNNGNKSTDEEHFYYGQSTDNNNKQQLDTMKRHIDKLDPNRSCEIKHVIFHYKSGLIGNKRCDNTYPSWLRK